jgi:hypothetical protein
MFEEHPEWWDVCCHIQTGKVIISAQSSMTAEATDNSKDLYEKFDAEFFGTTNASVGFHYGEDSVRAMFQSYTQHILDMFCDEEEFPSELHKASELEANKSRMDQMKNTKTLQQYLQVRRNLANL